MFLSPPLFQLNFTIKTPQINSNYQGTLIKPQEFKKESSYVYTENIELEAWVFNLVSGQTKHLKLAFSGSVNHKSGLNPTLYPITSLDNI